MYVNPFWMGVLVTLVTEIMLVLGIVVLSILHCWSETEDESESSEKRQ